MLVLCGLLSLLGAVPAKAAVAPGDVLVSDSGFSGLLKVDPETGAVTPFGSNSDPVNAGSELFVNPIDVAVTASGLILVADGSAFGGTGGVIAVDPQTGKQTKLSANDQPANTPEPLFDSPNGIEILPSGVILVVDRRAFGNQGGVIAVDPATGKQSVFSSNTQAVNAGSQLFGDPRGGIEILPSGTVLVGDNGPAAEGVIAIDPATGKQSLFSSNLLPINANTAFFQIPVDPLLAPDGRLYVADQNAFGDGGLVGVDPATGKQSLVSSNDQPVNAGNGFYSDPFDLAFGHDGRIIVADAGAFGGGCTEGCGGLISVDPATGAQRVLSNNDQPANAASLPYNNPLGVAVYPLRCEGLQATITGTPGADVLQGTAGRDVIAGLGGNDRINAGGGPDVVCAGAGADMVKGVGGKDRVLGEGGGDRLLGGKGNDRLVGGKGRDTLLGQGGKDGLFGGPGRDVLKGGPGKDKLRGGPGKDKERK